MRAPQSDETRSLAILVSVARAPPFVEQAEGGRGSGPHRQVVVGAAPARMAKAWWPSDSRQ